MGLKWNAKNTWWFVDQKNKMMLLQNQNWDKNGDNGKRDAIGRTMKSFYTYGDKRFIEGIESCWEKVYVKPKWIKRLFKKKSNYYYQGHRYPTHDHPVGMSRDHVANTIIAYKIAGKSDEEIWEFVKHLRYKISNFARFTPEMWLWARAVSGRRGYLKAYFKIQYSILKMQIKMQNLILRVSGIGPEVHQDEFHHMQNEDKPKRIKLLTSMLYPVYALHILAWQIKVLDDSPEKRKLQNEAIKLCPEYNYAIKILLDHYDDVCEDDINNYKAMEGERWTTILNKWWNSRSLKIIKDPKRLTGNVLDVDYLKKLWKKK